MNDLTRAIPALFVLLWATGFIGARYAMPWAEPFTFLWVRFALTFGVLLLIIPMVNAKAIGPRNAFHAAIAGVLMHGVYLGGVFWAVRNGLPAGFAGLIVGLQPMLTAVIAGLFLGEKVTGKHWLGLVVGLAGVTTVLSPKFGSISGGVTVATIGAAVVAVIAMSVGTVWQKRFVATADLVTVTLYQYVGGWAVTFLVSLTIETQEFVLNGELVFAMVWLVFVLSLGAIFLLMILIREGEVARVASLFYLVPAVTALLAWFLFDETLTPVQLVGMAITTFGVALATRRTPRQPAPATARASR
ncbi:DMT family transporter [Nitratireductor rhodophyticola]|uniref:DMT family transporter n=1 Tax=Nitratireductor rhodophyticola TaxID=2854036 RepID=UPI0008140EE3|nr:DMT family transporter [Nitratireductor rhodophyticola]WPZ15937.1 DMT family transporter [Nitratireductor rhodophyticola]